MTEGGTPSTGAPMTGLSHVQLVVTDVSTSARWYADALGLEPYAEDRGVGYIALRHRGSRMVVVLTSGAGAGRDGSLDHLAFAVPDGGALRSWADHLSHIGIDHPGVVMENGNPSLQLRDPDGIAIELVAPGLQGT